MNDEKYGSLIIQGQVKRSLVAKKKKECVKYTKIKWIVLTNISDYIKSIDILIISLNI